MKYDYVISGESGASYDWWAGRRGTTAQMVRDFLAKHNGEEVHIAVSSPGGSVADGLEIYQAICDHGKCNMHIIGMTASAATFLCMGAKSVDMVDGSLILIHNASTLIDEWQAANKSQLDQLIAKFQKERADLDTVDKVIASLYAKRCGKKVEDCLAKMDKAAWLTAQDALDFGIVDDIRKDDSCKKKKCNFSNDIFKSYGLPPFPKEAIADEFGNPTRSFLEKTKAAFKDLFKNDCSTTQNSKDMINIFKNIMGVLVISDGLLTNDKDEVVLTQAQVKTLDDKFGELTKQVADLTEANKTDKDQVTKLTSELQKVKDELKEAQDKVKNLEGAPGDTTAQAGLETNADDLTSVYNRAKELFDSVN